MVEYNQDTMWFDYQALFEQRRNVVLRNIFGIDVTSMQEIRHVSFEHNNLARNAILGNSTDKNIISDLCKGNLYAINIIIRNLSNYIYKHREVLKDKNNDDLLVLECNYKNLLKVKDDTTHDKVYDFLIANKDKYGYITIDDN